MWFFYSRWVGCIALSLSGFVGWLFYLAYVAMWLWKNCSGLLGKHWWKSVITWPPLKWLIDQFSAVPQAPVRKRDIPGDERLVEKGRFEKHWLRQNGRFFSRTFAQAKFSTFFDRASRRGPGGQVFGGLPQPGAQLLTDKIVRKKCRKAKKSVRFWRPGFTSAAAGVVADVILVAAVVIVGVGQPDAQRVDLLSEQSWQLFGHLFEQNDDPAGPARVPQQPCIDALHVAIHESLLASNFWISSHRVLYPKV